MHFDPRYLEGGWAICPEIVCCRQDRGIAPNPADRAGRWGDYRDCGTPWLGKLILFSISKPLLKLHFYVNSY